MTQWEINRIVNGFLLEKYEMPNRTKLYVKTVKEAADAMRAEIDMWEGAEKD